MNTVLIVDDSLTLRQIVSDILRKSGLNVVEASDGIEAKEQIHCLGKNSL